VSGLFALVLGWAWLTYSSELAQAQAADSLMDFAGAFVLAWVVRVAQQPRDANHPFGHGRAEPLGALAVAMLAGMLALRVAQGAVEAIWLGSTARVDPLLLEIFLAKVLFKGSVVAWCRSARSPALRALAVDAQNDVLVGLLSVAGYVAMRFGYENGDAVLALPIAFWIGWSGFRLARENIDLLMGHAPPQARQRELEELARRVPGVLAVSELRAQHLGTKFSLHVRVLVPGDLTVAVGHDIGERVRTSLEAEPDVSHCAVQVDAHLLQAQGHVDELQEGAG
jgi:cation diffusion facilitator family transporter